jgi:hypothetical protein
MIADRADHARLQVVESDVIGKAADVQLCVVMTARIAATDERPVSTATSQVGQRHGLVVEQKVRDCPGHLLSKRDRGGSANEAMGRSGNGAALPPVADVHKPADESRSFTGPLY